MEQWVSQKPSLTAVQQDGQDVDVKDTPSCQGIAGALKDVYRTKSKEGSARLALSIYFFIDLVEERS